QEPGQIAEGHGSRASPSSAWRVRDAAAGYPPRFREVPSSLQLSRKEVGKPVCRAPVPFMTQGRVKDRRLTLCSFDDQIALATFPMRVSRIPRVLRGTTTMKKLLASAAAVLIASPALAGALIFEPEPEPVVTVAPAPAPAPIANWTGPYAGVQVGWGDGEVDVDTDILDFTADDDGLVYGAQLGYDYDFGNGFVLGAEASYLQADIEPS